MKTFTAEVLSMHTGKFYRIRFDDKIKVFERKKPFEAFIETLKKLGYQQAK